MDSVDFASASVPRHPVRNTYRVSNKFFTIHSEVTAANPFGFMIRTEPPLRTPTPYLHLHTSARFTLWGVFVHPTLFLKALFARGPPASSNAYCSVIPEALQEYLIVVTPPPGTFFPTHYPIPNTARIWSSPSTTVDCLTSLRASGVPEILVLNHPIERVGQQQIQRGDVIFVGGEGYYVSAEIGPLPSQISWGRRFVALQTHTISQEMQTLYVPSHYVAPPQVSGGIITGELAEDGEER